MFRTHRKDFIETNWSGLRRSAERFACVLLLLIWLPIVASAYTIVLKSGRRIEVPEKFTVTTLTLTYETAPGLNVTILMSSIDLAATARANNEPAGSLLKRASKSGGEAAFAPSHPRRELTQADVEAGRRARLKSWEDYERRRSELGLPSLEESRRRTAEETKRLGEASLQSSASVAEAESYWRARASSIRTETAALDAQINYIRARLAELPDYSSTFGAYTFISGSTPYYPSRLPVNRVPLVTGHPGFMRGINGTGAQSNVGFAAFGGTGQNQAQLNVGLTRANVRRRGIITQGIIVSPASIFGVPAAGYDSQTERATLISRFHELEAQRAGLQARWRLLEEEARRAGAPPGWLRP